MKIKQEITINDEPLIVESTGKRTATLTYNGPKFLYIEYDNISKKLLTVTHISETPDMEEALTKLTPIEGREIIEISAEENIIAASYLWSVYTLEVENYEEELEDGETYRYEYTGEPKLGEIFDLHNMTWDKDKQDYEKYKFVLHSCTDEEILNSIEGIKEKVQTALVENTALTDAEKEILENYITQLNVTKDKINSGIENWKVAFPACGIGF
jgi:YD repeat-containing protein